MYNQVQVARYHTDKVPDPMAVFVYLLLISKYFKFKSAKA